MFKILLSYTKVLNIFNNKRTASSLKRLILCSLYYKKATKMSIIISNGDLVEVIKKKKLESIEEVTELDNVDGKANNSVEKLVIDSEAD